MTIASIEIGRASQGQASSINGICVQQEQLTVASATTNTMSNAVTSLEPGLVARIATDDTGCYVAIGTTPDPTATANTSATTTRRFLPAAASIELPIAAGMKVAVRGL